MTMMMKTVEIKLTAVTKVMKTVTMLTVMMMVMMMMMLEYPLFEDESKIS